MQGVQGLAKEMSTSTGRLEEETAGASAAPHRATSEEEQRMSGTALSHVDAVYKGAYWREAEGSGG